MPQRLIQRDNEMVAMLNSGKAALEEASNDFEYAFFLVGQRLQGSQSALKDRFYKETAARMTHAEAAYKDASAHYDALCQQSCGRFPGHPSVLLTRSNGWMEQ